MSEGIFDQLYENLDLVTQPTGKLFIELKKGELYCKPYLMQLKSLTLDKLDKMQRDAYEQLKQNLDTEPGQAGTTTLNDKEDS